MAQLTALALEGFRRPGTPYDVAAAYNHCCGRPVPAESQVTPWSASLAAIRIAWPVVYPR
jgi:hypothetical protein